MIINLPQRKLVRLQDYDYSRKGAYFLTICAFQHLDIFSDVVYSENNHYFKLSHIGNIINAEINKIAKFPYVYIDTYIIMPNHVHMIMVIKDGDNRKTISDILCSLKSISTITANKQDNTPGRKIWQSSFNDHIIRDKSDYWYIKDYIKNNPQTWSKDKFNLN